MPNPICHFEIGAKDLQNSIKFYKDLFDWNVRLEESMNYGLIGTGEEPGGGIEKLSADEKPRVIVYVAVDDIEAKLKEAEGLGGKIIQPKKAISPEHGFFGLFTDPDGNVIGLWCKT